VRAALPAGGTLVELVRFRPCDFLELCAGRDGLLPARYVAFVLRAGGEGAAMIDVGSVETVEGRGGAEALRAALAPHLRVGPLVVGHGGRLKRSTWAALGAEVRGVRSGRELASGLLEPRRIGWVAVFLSWLGL
jgi:hypothetical protein